MIRELLAALRDPYTRFVPPTEFKSMLKYDVSGVGLNLGTAEEFANKTVRAGHLGGTWLGGSQVRWMCCGVTVLCWQPGSASLLGTNLQVPRPL